MNTYEFFRENGCWHLKMPQAKQKGKKQACVDLVDGADTMLNLMSDGANEVTLALNTEPFENAELLELLQPCQPFLEGGYYLMRQHDGKEVNYEMWICGVSRVAFNDVPEKIYVKKLTSD